MKGVTCHMAYFDRGVYDRLKEGSWFENPSNGSINCVLEWAALELASGLTFFGPTAFQVLSRDLHIAEVPSPTHIKEVADNRD